MRFYKIRSKKSDKKEGVTVKHKQAVERNA